MDEYDEDEYGGQHIEMKEVCAMNSKTHILKPNHYYLSTNTSTHTGHILDTSGHILDTSGHILDTSGHILDTSPPKHH